MEVEHTPRKENMHESCRLLRLWCSPNTIHVVVVAPDAGSRRRRGLGRGAAYAPIALLGGPAVVRGPLRGPRPWPTATKPHRRACPYSSSSATTIVLCWEIYASPKLKNDGEREMAVYLVVDARSAAVCASAVAPVSLSRARSHRCVAASGAAQASAPGFVRADAAIPGASGAAAPPHRDARPHLHC